MPKALQKVTGTGHTTWTAFCNAIRTATLTQIEEAKEEEKEAKHICNELKRLQELKDMPMKNLANAFQRATISSTNAPPRYYMPRNQNLQSPNPPVAQNLGAAGQFMQPQQPRGQHPYQRSPEDRWADVVRLALVIQPKTAAGHSLYNNQIAQWNTDNPRQVVSELHPYPLTPGTKPVGSGECWKCGLMGHMGPNCDATNQVPPMEQRWRSIGASIRRNIRTTNLADVNIVSMDQEWLAKEEYDRQVIADFLASQGKGQGSSV
jgi:hypothetical protein